MVFVSPQVEKAVEERVQWCDVQMGALNATPNTEDVPVTVAQIQSQAQAFDAVVRPIVNKPKPKPKVIIFKNRRRDGRKIIQ